MSSSDSKKCDTTTVPNKNITITGAPVIVIYIREREVNFPTPPASFKFIIKGGCDFKITLTTPLTP
jgi:hypothetical protein